MAVDPEMPVFVWQSKSVDRIDMNDGFLGANSYIITKTMGKLWK